MNSLPTNGYETSPPSGVSPRVRRLAPIIVPIAILALAGAGFLAYRLDSSTPVVSSSVLLAPSVISGGDGHTCALISRGKVECWGENGSYELGNGTNTDSSTPVKVSDITNAIEVSAGGGACALISGGKVECWPPGMIGSTAKSTTPIQVPGITNAIQISIGGSPCALLSGGKIECWGPNNTGQLGNGTTKSHSTPVAVSNITDATQVAANTGFACALLTSRKVECWGDNWYGQLGNGTAGGEWWIPVTVVGIP